MTVVEKQEQAVYMREIGIERRVFEHIEQRILEHCEQQVEPSERRVEQSERRVVESCKRRVELYKQRVLDRCEQRVEQREAIARSGFQLVQRPTVSDSRDSPN